MVSCVQSSRTVYLISDFLILNKQQTPGFTLNSIDQFLYMVLAFKMGLLISSRSALMQIKQIKFKCSKVSDPSQQMLHFSTVYLLA